MFVEAVTVLVAHHCKRASIIGASCTCGYCFNIQQYVKFKRRANKLKNDGPYDQWNIADSLMRYHRHLAAHYKGNVECLRSLMSPSSSP